MAYVVGTAISAYPNGGSNDATAGDTAWSNPSNITTPGKAPFTNYTSCTLAAGDETQYLVATFTPLKWRDFNGAGETEESEGIPTGATVIGMQFYVRAIENGTTTDIDEVEVRLVVAGTIQTGGDNKSLGRQVVAGNISANSRDVAGYKYGGRADNWGTTLPTPAQLNAGTCGIAIRYANTGAGAATVTVDTIVCRVFTTEGSFTCVVRSNSVDTTKMVPWTWHGHVHASAWSDYSKRQCPAFCEIIEFPEGWSPATFTDERRGVPTGFDTHTAAKVYGWQQAHILDVAGTYKRRWTIVAPDGSEVSTADETVTVAADTRDEAFCDGNAAGADDGSSLADAFEDINDAIAWLVANPADSVLWLVGGQTYEVASTGAVIDSIDNSQIRVVPGTGLVTITTATAANSTPFSFQTNTRRLLIDGGSDGILFTTASPLTDSSNAINVQGAVVRNITLRNCQNTNRSSFCEWSASGLQVDGVYFENCDSGQAHRYGRGLFSDDMRQVVTNGGTFTSRGTNGNEGIVRYPVTTDMVTECWVRYAQVGASIQGIRTGGSNVYLHQPSFSGTGGWAVGGIGSRDDVNICTNGRCDGADFDVAATAQIGPGSFTHFVDLSIVNSVFNGGESTNPFVWVDAFRCGSESYELTHCVLFGSAAQTVTLAGTSVTGFTATLRNRIGNCLFVRSDPQTAMTGRWVDVTYATATPQETHAAFDQVGGNIFGMDNDGTVSRNNFRVNQSNRTLATWNAESFVGTDIHSRLPYGYLNELVSWGLTDYSWSGTVAAGTSTTVFTLSVGASAVDDYYNGASITVTGLGTVVVQDYVGSTRQVTTVSALSGTPSGGEAVSISRDFSTERAQGKSANAAGAPFDYRGVFRDLSGTDTAPGLLGVESLPTMSDVTAVVGDETALLSWSAVSGATTYRVWINYGSISSPVWYLYAETTATEYAVTGLTNDESAILGVSVVDDLYNESSVFQIAATPLRGPDTDRIYGTGGVSVSFGTAPTWTNPENVDGNAANDASPATVSADSEFTAYIATSIPATPIDGTLVAIKLGIRGFVDGSADPSAKFGVQILNAALSVYGYVVNLTATGGASPTDYEGYMVVDTGTMADFKAAIEAGIDAGDSAPNVPVGLALNGVTLGGATDFSAIEVWLTPVLAGVGGGIVGGTGPTGKAKTIPIGLIHP